MPLKWDLLPSVGSQRNRSADFPQHFYWETLRSEMTALTTLTKKEKLWPSERSKETRAVWGITALAQTPRRNQITVFYTFSHTYQNIPTWSELHSITAWLLLAFFAAWNRSTLPILIWSWQIKQCLNRGSHTGSLTLRNVGSRKRWQATDDVIAMSGSDESWSPAS